MWRYRLFKNSTKDGTKVWKYNHVSSHARLAQERIQEFARLQRARHLLDAVSFINDLLTDGSNVEILNLAGTIINRLKVLGVLHTSLNNNENFNDLTRAPMLKPVHTGVYHCCTFCSSGGKKEAVCGCRGTMPGGYRGCGHGHLGHPGVNHWSCCGSILHYGPCLVPRKYMYQLTL